MHRMTNWILGRNQLIRVGMKYILKYYIYSFLQDNGDLPGVPVSGGVISTGELESLSDDEEWTSTWASWSLKTLELMLKSS